MPKRLTITISPEIYDGLYATVGPRHISRFIEDLLRPHVTQHNMANSYRLMAEDEAREAEALEWAEATVGDVGDAT